MDVPLSIGRGAGENIKRDCCTGKVIKMNNKLSIFRSGFSVSNEIRSS